MKTQDTKIDAGTSIGNEGSPTLEISGERAKKEDAIDDSLNSTLTVPDVKDSVEIIEAEIFTSVIRVRQIVQPGPFLSREQWRYHPGQHGRFVHIDVHKSWPYQEHRSE